jgi:hypothetical protein
MAHVSEEILEAGIPSFAHCNAATAVVLVASCLLIQTPLLHADPANVFSGSVFSVRDVALSGHVTVVTSAGLGKPLLQMIQGNQLLGSAIASAAPRRAFQWSDNAFDGDKTTKSFTGNVLRSLRHRKTIAQSFTVRKE